MSTKSHDLVKQADDAFERGRLDTAEARYNAALSEDHGDPEAAAGLARVLLARGKTAEAKSRLEGILARAPRCAPALVWRALIDEREEKLDRALERLREARSFDPRWFYAAFHLGRLLARRGDVEEASRHLDDATRLDAEQFIVHFHRGLALIQLGQVEAGMDALHRVLRMNPRFAPAYLALVEILRAAGREDIAAEVVLAGARNCPENVELAMQAADLVAHHGKLREAGELMEQAARGGGASDPRALKRLALLRLANGDVPGAEQAAKRRCELTPDDPDAHFDLGIIYESVKLLDPAKNAYRRALAAGGEAYADAWKALTNLGELLAAEGLAEGNQMLEDAARKAPPNELEPRYNLALARWNRGDRAGARKVAEEVAKAKGGSESIRHEAKRFLAAMAKDGA